ncbi:hypothetical protein TNCV_640181 [Trichonephila clavipes]|nr:hypothetical protein TNCV_640181 [Trichonephila clavipes]
MRKLREQRRIRSYCGETSKEGTGPPGAALPDMIMNMVFEPPHKLLRLSHTCFAWIRCGYRGDFEEYCFALYEVQSPCLGQ